MGWVSACCDKMTAWLERVCGDMSEEGLQTEALGVMIRHASLRGNETQCVCASEACRQKVEDGRRM